MPARELRAGIEVRRPRYLHLPRLVRGNAMRFARVGLRTILDELPAPEVVVADYAWPAAMAAAPARERGIPFLINGRGSDVLQVSGEAGLGDELSGALRAAGRWCAVSGELVAVMDRLGGDEGRGRLVPNGIDLELFAPADRGEARARLGLEPELQVVLVVGHLIERKDPLLALEAFARGAPPDARCIFVGDGPLRARLEARIERLGLSGRVRLAGEIDPEQLAGWYAAADCLLLTSSREGRPNVVLEALAAGRPAVATAAGGTGEILEDWTEELLVDERSVEAVAAKLGRVLADPPEPARLRASVAHLSWDVSCAALERCLEETIG